MTKDIPPIFMVGIELSVADGHLRKLFAEFVGCCCSDCNGGAGAIRTGLFLGCTTVAGRRVRTRELDFVGGVTVTDDAGRIG